MAQNGQHAMWERQQTELWDRIFQVTQDVVALADAFRAGSGEGIVKTELVRCAMRVGAELVRANAALERDAFLHHLGEARLLAIETDYWLRLAYVLQQDENVQRDVSSLIAQYATIIDLLQKLLRHTQGEAHVIARHTKGPLVS